MGPAAGNVPDWRDAQAYAPLLRAERAGFAWEWLRRDPAFGAAAAASSRPVARAGERLHARPAQPAAALWGLHAFEDPGLAAPLARPVWRADAHPLVLKARASLGGSDADLIDLSRIASSIRVVRGEAGSEHVLLSDGFKSIRLDIVEGSIASRPVRLAYELTGIAGVERPLLALRRLLALHRSGRFSVVLHPRETRTSRWVLLLRAYDGLGAGASQREIAARLLSREACAADWRSNSPSLRSQVQRLVRAARQLAGGGYRQFLR